MKVWIASPVRNTTWQERSLPPLDGEELRQGYPCLRRTTNLSRRCLTLRLLSLLRAGKSTPLGAHKLRDAFPRCPSIEHS